MNIHVVAAVVATIVLILMMCLQLLLAAGLPLGRVAWGGRHRVLPKNLRMGSLAAAIILGVADWVILARAGLVEPGAESPAVRVATWVFGGYLALNSVVNLTSRSQVELYAMAPLVLLIAVCFFIVTIS